MNARQKVDKDENTFFFGLLNCHTVRQCPLKEIEYIFATIYTETNKSTFCLSNFKSNYCQQPFDVKKEVGIYLISQGILSALRKYISHAL